MDNDVINLRTVFEDIKQEEQALKQELQQLISVEHSLEKELEQVNLKYAKARDCRNNMQDDFSKDKFKFEEKDNEAKKLESQNQCIRSENEALCKKMKNLKAEYECAVDNYVLSVEKICSVRRNASNIYTEHGLLENIEQMKVEISSLNESLKKTEDELDKVNAEMINVMGNTRPDRELAIPLEQRCLILNMLDDENAAAQRALEHMTREKTELTEELARYVSSTN